MINLSKRIMAIYVIEQLYGVNFDNYKFKQFNESELQRLMKLKKIDLADFYILAKRAHQEIEKTTA